MATYNELYTVWTDGDNLLLSRILVAVLISAADIMQESTSTPNHADRYRWAAKVSTDPNREAQRFFNILLGANKDATVSQIVNVSDTVIQNQVESTVDAVAIRDAAIGI